MSEPSDTNVSPAAKPPRHEAVSRSSHLRVAISCVMAFAFMGAMAFAAVPFYRMFCQVTGYGGTTRRAEKAPDAVFNRIIRVRFDGNVTPGMPWEFEPVQRTMDVKVGENALAFFRAKNTSDKTITGTAAFNVAPEIGGLYFSKIQCFCFTEQTLAPGATVDMPVSFFIDPSIMKDKDADTVQEIALSYTFYPANGTGKPSAQATTGGEVRKGS